MQLGAPDGLYKNCMGSTSHSRGVTRRHWSSEPISATVHFYVCILSQQVDSTMFNDFNKIATSDWDESMTNYKCNGHYDHRLWLPFFNQVYSTLWDSSTKPSTCQPWTHSPCAGEPLPSTSEIQKCFEIPGTGYLHITIRWLLSARFQKDRQSLSRFNLEGALSFSKLNLSLGNKPTFWGKHRPFIIINPVVASPFSSLS